MGGRLTQFLPDTVQIHVAYDSLKHLFSSIRLIMTLNFKNKEEIVSTYFTIVFATKYLINRFKMFISTF